jgi:hypothetical protein
MFATWKIGLPMSTIAAQSLSTVPFCAVHFLFCLHSYKPQNTVRYDAIFKLYMILCIITDSVYIPVSRRMLEGIALFSARYDSLYYEFCLHSDKPKNTVNYDQVYSQMWFCVLFILSTLRSAAEYCKIWRSLQLYLILCIIDSVYIQTSHTIQISRRIL